MAVARYYDHDRGEWVLLAAGRDGASGASSWDDLTDKPATFPPETHTHTASQISDATTTGRNVLKASSQAAARTAIGAGTSNLALGTTSSTAARGNHTHTASSIGAAPASHTHTTADITDLDPITFNIGAGYIVKRTSDGSVRVPSTPSDSYSATSKSYVDGRTPEIRVVSSPSQATSPGVLYVVTGG